GWSRLPEVLRRPFCRLTGTGTTEPSRAGVSASSPAPARLISLSSRRRSTTSRSHACTTYVRLCSAPFFASKRVGLTEAAGYAIQPATSTPPTWSCLLHWAPEDAQLPGTARVI